MNRSEFSTDYLYYAIPSLCAEHIMKKGIQKESFDVFINLASSADIAKLHLAINEEIPEEEISILKIFISNLNLKKLSVSDDDASIFDYDDSILSKYLEME